tara:strand:- start:149 stop:1366 length:1218 start_codon:yes stop_codon:yes gene_type:complete
MSKTKHYEKEIDLFDLLKPIWNGRWKVILITITTAFICTFYAHMQPNSYTSSTAIYRAENSEFIKYTILNEILMEKFGKKEDRNINYLVNSPKVFEKLINEFRDYDEVVEILKNDPNISKSLINLSETDKRKVLINHAKSFVISEIIVTPKRSDKSKLKDYTLSYTWHNVDEGREIFKKALNLSLTNVKNKILNDLSQLAMSIDKKNLRDIKSLTIKLELAEKSQRERDLMRVRYLKEQSLIAKELGIENNQFQRVSVSSDADSIKLSVNSKIKTKSANVQGPLIEIPIEFPYFLVGFKAIDREIRSIKNRPDTDTLLTSYDYNITKQELIKIDSDLSSQELRENIQILESDNINNWISYDFSLGVSKSLKSLKKYFIVGTFVGFLIGLIYVFISNVSSRSKKKA